MWEKIMRQMTAKICQLKIFYESFSKTKKISNNDFPLYFHAASIYGFSLVLLCAINPIPRGGGNICPPTTFRQFSPDLLIRGGSNYTLNSSFVITEHIKLVPGQKKFPTARESPPKSAG